MTREPRRPRRRQHATPRGSTFAQKALARAAGLESVEVGQVVDARPDLALSHDNTAAIRQIWLRFGRERVAIPERMAITLDHAVPAPTPRHAQNHAEVRRFVAEQGIAHFFEVGRGICHQVFSEEALLEPGQLILGSDSHTPHFGWMGAFGAGVGSSEMAVIWATGELWLRVPESVRIELHGTPPPWVSAKDAALHVIGALGEDGGLYASVEIVGEAVAALLAREPHGARQHDGGDGRQDLVPRARRRGLSLSRRATAAAVGAGSRRRRADRIRDRRRGGAAAGRRALSRRRTRPTPPSTASICRASRSPSRARIASTRPSTSTTSARSTSTRRSSAPAPTGASRTSRSRIASSRAAASPPGRDC